MKSKFNIDTTDLEDIVVTPKAPPNTPVNNFDAKQKSTGPTLIKPEQMGDYMKGQLLFQGKKIDTVNGEASEGFDSVSWDSDSEDHQSNLPGPTGR